MLSGIAGHYPGHPIRTRSVLADDAGTVLALFLWPVERLRRVARLPVSFSRGPTNRDVSLGYLRSVRFVAPVVSAGWLLKGRSRRLRPLIQLG